jgi:hypothetical protein
VTKKLFAALVISTLIAPAQAVGAVTIIATPTATMVSLDQKTITLTPPRTNSPGAWSIEIENPKIASANGLTLTLLSAGTSIIRYAQAASGAYNAASRSSRLTVTPGTPTLGEFRDQTVALSAGSFTLTAPTSSSDGAWSFQSLDQSIATISGNKVTLLDGGEVSIRATQSPTLNWLTTTATMKLSVTAPSPTVGTLSDITLSIDSVSKVELILPVSNSKGTWTLSSSDPSVASVNGLTVTALKAGTTKISAKQAPFGGYRSIIVTMNITILAVDPVVSAGGFIDQTVELIPGRTQVRPLPAPASNSPGVWTFTSSDAAIASMNGNFLTALKPGKVSVTAVQGPALKFGASKPFTISVFVVGRQSLTAPANVEKLSGDPDVAIVYPISQSTGKWSATSSDPTIAAINGSAIKLGNAGTATITLTQEATDSWTASSTTYLVRVIGVTPTLGAFVPFEISVGEKLTTAKSPLSNSAGRWIYSSSDPKVIAVIDNVITGVSIGSAVISAYQQPAGKYGQSNTLQTTVTVKAGAVVTPTPTPTPKPSVSASANPATSVSVKASATRSKRVISIKVTNAGPAQIIAMIDSKVAKVGKNKVKPGKRKVRVYSGSILILSKTFKVK